MSDHDDLLADADGFHNEQYPPHVHALVADLAAALRSALATRPQPLFEGSTRHLTRLDAWNVSNWPEGDIVVYAVAGSATPGGDDDE